MNFKVFIRTFFIVVLASSLIFVIYANNKISDEPFQAQADNQKTLALDPVSAVNSATDGTSQMDGTQHDNDPDNSPDNSGVETSGDKPAEAGSENNASRSYIREKVAINISALGDVVLGQDWRYNYTDSFDYVFEKVVKMDYSYFFKNIVDILSQDDLTIANLETSLSNETQKAEKYDYGNNYWFKGRPEFANILKAGSVEVANLANNHTYDYGQKGYDSTCKALEEAGIEYFGYSDISYKEVKGITIGLAGFNQLGNVEQGLDMDAFKAEVAEMTHKIKGECDLVIANFHWGEEYKYKPNALQKELAYLAIDSGADLVIGNHPHVLQPVEKYNGKYIVYSLGNFCYGGRKQFEDYDTAIYQQTFVFDSDNVLQLISEPAIIPCSVSSQKTFNNYQPAIAKEPQFSSVYSKLNLPMTEKAVPQLTNSDMVRVDKYIDDIMIEMRYAGSNNIVGKPVYESDLCYLRKGTADKLKKANGILLKQGYIIKVWDGYRAGKYQQLLYDNAPVKAVFMNPDKGTSNHTRGAAVDCTLVTPDGREVDMPSDFDDGSALAYRTYEKCTEEQKQNALILENAMKSVGFIPLKSEWWHFDDTEYKSYEPFNDYVGED